MGVSRWWLTALASIGLMCLASSHSYFVLYKPLEWTDEHVVRANSVGEFSFPARETDARHEAEVEVLSLERIDPEEVQGIEIPEGFGLWVTTTRWKAPKDSLLARCRMRVSGADGRDYDLRGQFEDWGAGELSHWPACTPPDQEGPNLVPRDQNDIFGEHVVDPGKDRPEQWVKNTPLILPEDTAPVDLHIGWNEPHFLTLELPSPAEDA